MSPNCDRNFRHAGDHSDPLSVLQVIYFDLRFMRLVSFLFELTGLHYANVLARSGAVMQMRGIIL